MKIFCVFALALFFVTVPADAQIFSTKRLDFTESDLVGFGVSYHTPHNRLGFNYQYIKEFEKGFFSEVIFPIETVRESQIRTTPVPYSKIVKTRDEWISVNGGVIIVIDRHTAGYFGFGLSGRKSYEKHRPGANTQGATGDYWLRIDEFGSFIDIFRNPNVVAGSLFTLPFNLVLRIGGSARPLSITVGLSIMVEPIWRY